MAPQSLCINPCVFVQLFNLQDKFLEVKFTGVRGIRI